MHMFIMPTGGQSVTSAGLKLHPRGGGVDQKTDMLPILVQTPNNIVCYSLDYLLMISSVYRLIIFNNFKGLFGQSGEGWCGGWVRGSCTNLSVTFAQTFDKSHAVHNKLVLQLRLHIAPNFEPRQVPYNSCAQSGRWSRPLCTSMTESNQVMS
jgi:hypothetical protein